MFYTDGKILIHKTNDVELLKEACKKVVDYMEEHKGFPVVFDINDNLGFPSTPLPEEVSYTELDAVLRPYVKLTAINEDSIYIADEKVINERYNYTEEELTAIATEISRLLKEKNQVEIEKASMAKSYKSKIDHIANVINEKNDLYSAGHTYKDYKCKVKLNFVDGKKYYLDSSDDSIVLRVEKMDANEKQLRIEHSLESGFNTQGENFNDTENTGTGTKEDPFVVDGKKKGEKGKKTLKEELIPDQEAGDDDLPI